MQDLNQKPRRRRVVMWSVAGVLVAALVVAGLLIARNGSSDNKKKNDKEALPAAPVEVAEVRRGSITTFLETTAALEARNTAMLVASRQGPVRSIDAEEGRWVRQGDVLARLDDTEARLAVERAEVSDQIARRESERGRQLRERGFLSDKDLDDLELKARSAKLALDEARYGLSQTRLVAPFSGRVTARMINLGETVTPGRECFRVEDFDPLLARVYFPERELEHIRAGQPALMTLDALPGREFQARVALVNPVVDRSNGTFKVTLEVRDPSRTLRPGNFARVRLRTGSFENTVVLPRRAMLSEDGESYVFVARGDTVARVGVKVGAVSGDTAQILAGLAQGDSVVTVGQGGLKQGARIKSVKL
jgi:membrane fusion protein (multidrug efflux system)